MTSVVQVIAIICDSYEEVSEEIVHMPAHNVIQDLTELLLEQKFVGYLIKYAIYYFYETHIQLTDALDIDSGPKYIEMTVPPDLQLATLVIKQQRRRKYQEGVIIRNRLNNTFDIEYKIDGEVEEQVHPVFIRPDDHTIAFRGLGNKGQQMFDCSKFMPGDKVTAYRGSSHFENVSEPQPTRIPGKKALATPVKRFPGMGNLSKKKVLQMAVLTPKENDATPGEFHIDLIVDSVRHVWSD